MGTLGNGRMITRNRGIADHSGWSRMRGMTTAGLAIVIAFLGLFAYAGIQLTPVYLNYMKVAGVVDGIKNEFDGQNPNVVNMRRSIERRFTVESVKVIEPRDVKISLEAGGYLVDATYDHTVPYLANVSFTVHFDKKTIVRR